MYKKEKKIKKEMRKIKLAKNIPNFNKLMKKKKTNE